MFCIDHLMNEISEDIRNAKHMKRIKTTKLGLTLVLILSFSFLLYSNSITLGEGYRTMSSTLRKSYLNQQILEAEKVFIIDEESIDALSFKL